MTRSATQPTGKFGGGQDDKFRESHSSDEDEEVCGLFEIGTDTDNSGSGCAIETHKIVI